MFQKKEKSRSYIFPTKCLCGAETKKGLVKIQKNSMLSEDVQEDMLVILQQREIETSCVKEALNIDGLEKSN